MNLLLDTHVLIWNMAQESKVGPKTRILFESKENRISYALEVTHGDTVVRKIFKIKVPSTVQAR